MQLSARGAGDDTVVCGRRNCAAMRLQRIDVAAEAAISLQQLFVEFDGIAVGLFGATGGVVVNRVVLEDQDLVCGDPLPPRVANLGEHDRVATRENARTLQQPKDQLPRHDGRHPTAANTSSAIMLVPRCRR